MTFYLDTSVLLSLIVRDPHSADAMKWFARARPQALVSSFAAAEFSAVISRHVRTGHLGEKEGHETLGIFDAWLRRNAQVVLIVNDDVIAAEKIVRDFESKLLAPDALHLSVSDRLGATLMTFEKRLVVAAQMQAIAADCPV